MKKLRIMQWNADSLMSKREELKHFLAEQNIDIFLIQETKLVPKVDEPVFKGYELVRKDRKQKKGCEKNRGGGLLIGIKDRIPYSELRLNLRTEDDEITEALTIEIPTKNKKKIRITNVYIPPIRNTQSEEGRQRIDMSGSRRSRRSA